MSQDETIVSARWRRLDGPGEDKCRLVRQPGGWLLVGHARFGSARGESALDYVVRCDGDWQTTSADVTGRAEGAPVGLKIEVAEGVWRMNGAEQAAAQGCVDLDLGFTPATNLLPLRRLGFAPGVSVVAVAAWLPPGFDGLGRLRQSYTQHEGGGRYDYAAPEVGYAACLEVHESGFVTEYPQLWSGAVDDAD